MTPSLILQSFSLEVLPIALAVIHYIECFQVFVEKMHYTPNHEYNHHNQGLTKGLKIVNNNGLWRLLCSFHNNSAAFLTLPEEAPKMVLVISLK